MTLRIPLLSFVIDSHVECASVSRSSAILAHVAQGVISVFDIFRQQTHQKCMEGLKRVCSDVRSGAWWNVVRIYWKENKELAKSWCTGKTWRKMKVRVTFRWGKGEEEAEGDIQISISICGPPHLPDFLKSGKGFGFFSIQIVPSRILSELTRRKHGKRISHLYYDLIILEYGNRRC